MTRASCYVPSPIFAGPGRLIPELITAAAAYERRPGVSKLRAVSCPLDRHAFPSAACRTTATCGLNPACLEQLFRPPMASGRICAANPMALIDAVEAELYKGFAETHVREDC